eukprot:gnl/TRDRNA2_/TRDRNA2_170483_c1_seq1.p1 gnl/TRDRNA2_/TRDRNA2_170483_c1~~gnl/TRDRNA2_/TRDRNA2_170483_c1_seq1.p1  ORF type:complete len:285 (-),score=66.08 gnl/TRDRNA2_/TRDRNA2_170483_c1_seq1:65-919(-)
MCALAHELLTSVAVVKTPKMAPQEKEDDHAKKPKASKAGGKKDDAADAELLKDVHSLMEEKEFEKAAGKLLKLRERLPEDTDIMHNLGVVYTELFRYEEAEKVFWEAFEKQEKSKTLNCATMYGLAMVLTELGNDAENPKLLQGEAVYRDFLVYLSKHSEEQEGAVPHMYRGYVGLAHNLEKQKRWAEAAEVWTTVVELSKRIFGEESEPVRTQTAFLERASRLGRWQRVFRWITRSITIGVPCLVLLHMLGVQQWLGITTQPSGWGEHPEPAHESAHAMRADL